MEFEDTCRKLKPLLGERAERYLQAYLAEDTQGKAELRTAVELMAARLLGKELDRPAMTLSAPPADLAAAVEQNPAAEAALRPAGGVVLRGVGVAQLGLRSMVRLFVACRRFLLRTN